jgi:hypothetical protein
LRRVRLRGKRNITGGRKEAGRSLVSSRKLINGQDKLIDGHILWLWSPSSAMPRFPLMSVYVPLIPERRSLGPLAHVHRAAAKRVRRGTLIGRSLTWSGSEGDSVGVEVGDVVSESRSGR